MINIPMVDLKGQYDKIKSQIDAAVIQTIESANFINGPIVNEFTLALEKYLGVEHVVPCANGTDALQIALMSLPLKPGDEVICPSFTYVATAEVVSLLGLTPVMTDVDPDTFNLTADIIRPHITRRTKVIIPVHLYGQSCDTEPIMNLADEFGLYVIEDNAQALGAKYTFSDGTVKSAGTIGHIGTTSFFPTKNLGCYGDGGAMFTNDDEIAKKLKMIANHGQEIKYHHLINGCNSRLDSIQAAILNIKLDHIEEYSAARNNMAEQYDQHFANIQGIKIPKRQHNSTHVFHQYTLKIESGLRSKLMEYLKHNNIPSMIYYPIPLYRQPAFSSFVSLDYNIKNVEDLCSSVLSLPIHTVVENSSQDLIIEKVKHFFNKKNKI